MMCVDISWLFVPSHSKGRQRSYDPRDLALFLHQWSKAYITQGSKTYCTSPFFQDRFMALDMVGLLKHNVHQLLWRMYRFNLSFCVYSFILAPTSRTERRTEYSGRCSRSFVPSSSFIFLYLFSWWVWVEPPRIYYREIRFSLFFLSFSSIFSFPRVDVSRVQRESKSPAE